jgi:hypothetical protein
MAASGGVDGWLRHRPFIVGAGHAFTRRMCGRSGRSIQPFTTKARSGVSRAGLGWRDHDRRCAGAIAAAAHRRHRQPLGRADAGLANPPPRQEIAEREQLGATRSSPVAPMP